MSWLATSVMDGRPHHFHNLPLLPGFFTGTKLYCMVTRGTWVWTTCLRLLPDSAAAGISTRDHWVTVLLLQQPFYDSWTVSRTTWVSQYQKGKTNLDLLEQEIVSGCGISWAIRKYAPLPRQITMPASHHSVFYRLDALSAAQPTVSKHWRQNWVTVMIV